MRPRNRFVRSIISVVAGTGLLVSAAALSGAATGSATGSRVAVARPANAAAAPSLRLPDLVADAPSSPLLESYVDAAGARLLLRFHGYVHNAGSGPLEIRASQPDGARMTTVHQRAYDETGAHVDLSGDPAPTVLFEPNDSHDHWHLRSAARYSLWDERRTREVAPAMKAGFCLLDSQRMDAWAPASAAYTSANIAFCQQGLPFASSVTMGISSGWRDVYGRSLAYQWVDVSDVAPGSYWLSSEVDPDGVVIESQETNARAFASTASIVPGYRARSFKQRVDPLLLTPARINLQVDRYGDAGTLEFRIDEAPRVGRLDQPVGRWFRASSVSYTAPWGYQGQDFFRFSARSAESPFPRTPLVATASLGVRTAPVAQPSARSSRSARTQTSEPQATATPRRAPSLAAREPTLGDGSVAIPQVHVDGSDILLRTVATHPGIVHLRATAMGAILGECRVRAPAGQIVTCLLADAAALSAGTVTAVSELRAMSGRILGRAATGADAAPEPGEHHH